MLSCRTWARLAALLILPVLAVLPAATASAADLFLTGEQEIYLALDKLNAMGELPGMLANTRPYSTAAVRAALDNNPGTTLGRGFDAQLAKWVSFYSRKIRLIRGTAEGDFSDRRQVRDNEDGVPTPKGFSGRLSALAREETTPYLSAHASATTFFGRSDDDGTRIGETALEAGYPHASLQIGKITTWYGPGRRGSLIFTNNAQPYPGVRFHSPVPIAVPGIFSFLGNVQYDLFLARLDTDRPVPHPLLFGMRLATRPSRYIEIGLSRSIQYGGQGHSNSPAALWRAFVGNHINDPGTSENELAGFDVEVTLPFKVQPVQVYLEMAGEDQHRFYFFPFPEKWAYLGGVFLPSLLRNAAFDLRAEFALNHVNNNGPVWYVHPDYPHSYRGQILGHPMGTDASDLFLQGHYFFLPSTYLQLTANRTTRYSVGPVEEHSDRVAAGLVGWLSEKVRVETELALAHVSDVEGVAGETATDTSFRLAVSYQTGWGR